MQYSLQRPLETGVHADRIKRAGTTKVTTSVEDKHLSKRNRWKTALEFTTEFNSSPQQPVSLSSKGYVYKFGQAKLLECNQHISSLYRHRLSRLLFS